MIKPSMAELKLKSSILKSKTFFSTLEYAEVPDAPTDLFIPLVRQLQDEWDANFEAAEQHLSDMVGTNSSLQILTNCLIAEGIT